MRPSMALRDRHLADLHRRARELGVPRYRMLPRDELIEAVEEREGRGATEPAGREEAIDAGFERPRHEPEEGREDEQSAKAEPRPSHRREPESSEPPEPEPDTEAVVGVLDRMPQGYGFLRLSGLQEAEGDIYVSASQIRRCELRPGDEVSGPARPPRRILALDAELDPLVRAVDLLGPLGFGQRVLVLAQPRSGRTTLLRALGSAISKTDAHVCVVLADERPEEVPQWRGRVPEAEIFAATAEEEPREQVREAELAMGHAKRLAEAGGDVVVLIDSLSRLALGYRDPGRVKRMFGVGRELDEEGAGSLTVIATVLETDDRGSEVRAALETTENLLLRLDADLAAKGVFPSLVALDTRASGEEELRDPDELEKMRRLRAELAEMEPEEAARALAEQIAATASNAELLSRL